MKKKITLPEVDPVVLKPIFGIRPGLYILISLILLFLLILFILFVAPGLASNKAYVSFELNAKNVAIYDNGKYLGSTEGSIYQVESGHHIFSFKISGHDAGEIDVDVKKHIFFTLFHRNVQNIPFQIDNTAEIQNGVIEYFLARIAEDSKVIDYSDTYHFQPLYSEFAYNAVNLGFEDISLSWLYGALHVTSKTLYDDYLIGLSILENSSVAYNSDELEKLNGVLSRLYSSNESETISVNGNRDVEKPEREGSFFTYPETTIIMGRDSALSYPDINTAPIEITVPSFSIEGEVVSEYMYSLFIAENPYWAKSNKEKLIEDKMVDDGYLNGINTSTVIRSSRPIRNISYYAAEAYANWLSEKDGISYSLPSESQWSVAALSSKNKPFTSSLISIDTDNSSPLNMLGQLWELTSTRHIPLSRLFDYNKAQEISSRFDYDDIIIKGGSYINTEDGISVDTVGVVSKSTCSEYIGFRLVINE